MPPKKQTRTRQIQFAAILKSQRIFSPGRRNRMALRRRRPIVVKESMQIVLRSDLARGEMNLLRHEAKIAKLVKKLAAKHAIHVYKFANVGNHLHLLIQVSKRLLWKGFISGLAGGVARIVGYRVADAKQTKSAATAKGFWNARPFSRVISWGREFAMMKDYVTLNQLEGTGAIPTRKFMRKGADWRRIVALMGDEHIGEDEPS